VVLGLRIYDVGTEYKEGVIEKEREKSELLPECVSGDSRDDLVSPAVSAAGLTSDSGGGLGSFTTLSTFGSCRLWPVKVRRRSMYFCRVGYIWL
jgi:hypothetical protein